MTDGQVTYTFSARDDISPVLSKMTDGQKSLTNATNTTSASIDSQRIKSITTLESLHALRRGVRGLGSSMHELGIINDDTYKTFQQVSAGFELVIASAEILKGASVAIELLTEKEIGLAVATTYEGIVANPVAGLAAVGLAGAAVGGVAGYMIGASQTHNTSNTTTNITVNNTGAQGRRQASGIASVGSYGAT